MIGHPQSTDRRFTGYQAGETAPAPRAAPPDVNGVALTDPLTGLFNREFLECTLSREISRCQRRGAMLSVVLVDVDAFGSVNADWAPGAGDIALRTVAGLIRRQLRAADAACRYGDHAFAMVLPDTYPSGALPVSERIVATLRRQFAEREVGGCRMEVTVSAGVAWYCWESATKTALLEAAERALAEAKAAAGDRFVPANRSSFPQY